MKSLSLTAYPRTLNKRIGSKKVRDNDRVPAVIYGGKSAPKSLEVTNIDLDNLLHHSVSENILVDLAVNGNGDSSSKHLALVQEIQHHPLSGKIIHVDFREVAENEKVTVVVPVETTGEAVGVKTGGGVLEHVLFKLKVRALPKDLPAVLTIDVSHLEVGKSIHLGDIQAPEGVEILGNKEIPVVAVAAPLTEAAETAAEGAAGAPTQPEMIKEKKDDAAAGDKGGDKKAADKKK
jgi:large subunit ribosomal protein L25